MPLAWGPHTCSLVIDHLGLCSHCRISTAAETNGAGTAGHPAGQLVQGSDFTSNSFADEEFLFILQITGDDHRTTSVTDVQTPKFQNG